MSTLVVYAADTHPNSRVALRPPVMRLTHGDVSEASEAQQQLWRWWNEFLQRAYDIGQEARCTRSIFVLVGDGADDNTHSKAGLHSVHEDDIIDFAVETHRPVAQAFDDFVWIEGTPAHVGEYGRLERRAAQELGCLKHPSGTWTWPDMYMSVDGVVQYARHQPGTRSYRPWTEAAHRQAQMLWYTFSYQALDALVEAKERGEAQISLAEIPGVPAFAVFGHTHKAEDSGSETQPHVIYLSSWQLATDYAKRLPLRLAQPFGGVCLVCDGGVGRLTRIPIRAKRRLPVCLDNDKI